MASAETFSRSRRADLTLVVSEPARDGVPMTRVRGGEERDLAAIAAMGRARAGRLRFYLDRDVDFIQYAIATRRWLAGPGSAVARQLHFLIAEEGMTAVAYVVVSVVGDRWTLEECGDQDPSGAGVGALLQALSRARAGAAPSDDPCVAPAGVSASAGDGRFSCAFHGRSSACVCLAPRRRSRRCRATTSCSGATTSSEPTVSRSNQPASSAIAVSSDVTGARTSSGPSGRGTRRRATRRGFVAPIRSRRTFKR